MRSICPCSSTISILPACDGAWQTYRVQPAAVLRHRTSASRGGQFDYRENVLLPAKYRDLTDPFISPNVEPLSMLGHTPALKAGA